MKIVGGAVIITGVVLGGPPAWAAAGTLSSTAAVVTAKTVIIVSGTYTVLRTADEMQVAGRQSLGYADANTKTLSLDALTHLVGDEALAEDILFYSDLAAAIADLGIGGVGLAHSLKNGSKAAAGTIDDALETIAGNHLDELGDAGKILDDVVAPQGGARYVFDARVGRYRDTTTGRFAAARDLPWPANAGFARSTKQTVKTGTILDRYGSSSGRFLGEPSASISQRGMAAGSEGLPYARYRVLKPFDAQVGPAAPVPGFGATGGATQYLPGNNIQSLIENGFLELIK